MVKPQREGHKYRKHERKKPVGTIFRQQLGLYLGSWLWCRAKGTKDQTGYMYSVFLNNGVNQINDIECTISFLFAFTNFRGFFYVQRTTKSKPPMALIKIDGVEVSEHSRESMASDCYL